MALFYHGTTEEAWKLIQDEGVLWGKPCPPKHLIMSYRYTRYTYLTPHLDIAQTIGHGDVILVVEYEPVGVGSRIDNYGFNPPPGQTCWQFSVFEPIPIAQVSRWTEDCGCPTWDEVRALQVSMNRPLV